MIGALGPALVATAVLGMAGDDHFAPLQVLGQFFPSGMVGAGRLGFGQRVFFLRLGTLGFLLDFRGGHAGLVQEQRGLGRGKLFALGSPEAQVEQADFLVLDLQEFGLVRNDLLQARDFGGQPRQAHDLVLQTLKGLAGFCWQRVERNHLSLVPYT